jgi:uncharacterized Zn finger protein (UPF0148 family)
MKGENCPSCKAVNLSHPTLAIYCLVCGDRSLVLQQVSNSNHSNSSNNLSNLFPNFLPMQQLTESPAGVADSQGLASTISSVTNSSGLGILNSEKVISSRHESINSPVGKLPEFNVRISHSDIEDEDMLEDLMEYGSRFLPRPTSTREGILLFMLFHFFQ